MLKPSLVVLTRAAVAAAVLLAMGSAVLEAGGPLDGRKFKAEAGEKGKPKAEDDEISFADGAFHSTACEPYGFEPGSYKATTVAGVTTFEAETVSSKEGKIRWKGTVTGDRIEATYVWSKAGQKDVEYWLKGQAAR